MMGMDGDQETLDCTICLTAKHRPILSLIAEALALINELH